VTPRGRAVAELVFACAAVLGCAVSWARARNTVAVPPIADGQPATTSVAYDPQLLLLSLLLATVAGVLVVVGTARLRRVRLERAGTD
jgi:hypothetical protein